MTQITSHDHDSSLRSRFETLRRHVVGGIKWWAEHQAWPATDEIRINRHRSTCG